MQRYQADVVVASPAQLGEGPIWHRTELWWVDILAGMSIQAAYDLRKLRGKQLVAKAGRSVGGATT